MAISTVAGQKAKYKRMLISWTTGLLIVLFIHFFMYAVLYVNDTLVRILKDLASMSASRILGEGAQSLSLYDAVRTKAYAWDFYDGLVGLIMYIILVYYLVRFLLVYLKRMISIYVLALVSSLMGVKYALEKVTGRRSKSFGKWMKEFMFNVLLQSIHCLIYGMLMSIALQIALNSLAGLIVAILILQLILQADKIFMKIFGVGGSLLNDVNKPPENYFTLMAKSAVALRIAAIPFNFGYDILNGNSGFHKFYKFIGNYERGLSMDDIQEKIEMQDYMRKSKMATWFYNKINKIPIHRLQNAIKNRRESYELLGSNINYDTKRNIYKTIQLQKSMKQKRFKRAVDTGANLVKGTLNTVAAVGLLAEGITPAIHRMVKGQSQLKSKNSNNIKTYRRLHPDEHISRGIIGEAELASQKTKKDIKKANDKQVAQITIAKEEENLRSTIDRLKQATGMTHEEKVEELKTTRNIVKKTSISGFKIRKAIERYVYSNTGKTELDESDLDGILEILQEDLEDAGSDILIDYTMKDRIRDSLATLGYSFANGVDKKTFAKQLTEAVAQRRCCANCFWRKC